MYLSTNNKDLQINYVERKIPIIPIIKRKKTRVKIFFLLIKIPNIPIKKSANDMKKNAIKFIENFGYKCNFLYRVYI